MLKIIGLSIALASEVDNEEVIALNGGNSRSNRLSRKLTKFTNPKSGNLVKLGKTKSIKKSKFLTFKTRSKLLLKHQVIP